MHKKSLKEFHELGWSASAKILSIGAQYGVIAIVSRGLTAEDFGIWSLLIHLTALASILDFGLGGGGLRNALTHLYVTRKTDSIQEKKLFFSSFCFMWTLSLFLLCITSLFFYKNYFFFGDRNQEMPLLFFMLAVFVLIKLPFTLYASGFYAYQEIKLKAVIDCIESLGCFFVILNVALIKGSLKLFFCSYFLFLLLMNVVSFIWFVSRREWEWKDFVFRDVLSSVFPLFTTHLLFWLQNIVSIVLFGLSPVLIALLGNFVMGGEYSLIYRLYSLFIGIHFALLNPLWSYYTSAWHRNERNLVLNKCILSTKWTIFVLSIAAAVITLLYQPFLYFWTGKHIESLLLVILSGVWMVLYGVINCFSVFLNALNQIKQQLVFLCIGACLNVFLGIFLGKLMNMLGVVIAAIIALLPLLCSNILEVKKIRYKGTV